MAFGCAKTLKSGKHGGGWEERMKKGKSKLKIFIHLKVNFSYNQVKIILKNTQWNISRHQQLNIAKFLQIIPILLSKQRLW